MDKRWLDAVSAETPSALKVRVVGKSMLPTFKAGDSALVELVAIEDLHIGDFVFFRHGDTGYLHRYIGKQGEYVITKGDAHYWIDTPVAFDDVLGHVTIVQRGEKLIYDRTKHQFWHHITGLVHRMIGRTSTQLRRMKRWLTSLTILFMLMLVVIGVSASVGLTDFKVEAGEYEIFILWETASETGNLGFYIERSDLETSGFERIEVEYDDGFGAVTDDFIPSYDSAGALYEAMDVNVDEGVRYYYRLQDVPADGSTGAYSDIESDGINLPTSTPEPEEPTDTPIPPTATETPAASPTATLTPLPNVLFWADPETVTAGDCTTVQWQASNIKSLFFNGAPVGGFGAQAFCPCEDQTFTLIVYFNDGTSAERTVDVDVTGSCSDSPSVVATATKPPSPTQTPRPTSTPGAATDTDATPTRMIPPTPTSTMIPTLSPEGNGGDTETPMATSTPEPAQPAVTHTPTSETDSIDRIVIGSPEEEPSGISPAVWIGFGVLAGIVFVGGGIWLWRQNR